MLQTSLSGLVLCPLDASHCRAMYDLIGENRAHLTAHGDYTGQTAASFEMLEAELGQGQNPMLRFGIMLDQALIGRMDLVPVDPPRYGLGYWLDQGSTGKGYATVALQVLMVFAEHELQASDIYAGVTPGNYRSIAVLLRAGFQPVADFEAYRRFYRSLGHAPI